MDEVNNIEHNIDNLIYNLDSIDDLVDDVNDLKCKLNNILDDLKYNASNIKDSVDELNKNQNIAWENSKDLNDWVSTAISLLPTNIDLGMAMHIEEALNNLVKG